MTNNQAPLARRMRQVKEKLELIRARGWQHYEKNFGVASHRFEMNPPLDRGALREFEKKHAVTIPADYRAFLLEVGNGGAGPYYGLFPLERWDDAASDLGRDRPADYLSRPSPLKPDMAFDEDWVKGLSRPYEERYGGAIAIGTQGCSYDMLLIVAGEYRGSVCYVDLDDQPPKFRTPDFISWYEHWLDLTLGGREITWY
jgi:hypothetical protein